jgi:hypothetical protein
MPKEKICMKFGEMPYGTHFKEVNGHRKFIKLQDVLPSGLFQKSGRVVKNEDGSFSNLIECNSIDYDGIHAKCPDWLEFEILKLGKYHCKLGD